MAKDKSKKAAEAEEGTVKVKKDKSEKTSKPAPGSGDIGGPGSGGNFVPREQEGKLLLITPISLEEGIVTSNGTKDAIRADIVVLNKKKVANSEEISGGLIFPNVLQSQLQDALRKGTRVVGTLIEDIASKKPSQNAPWRLTAPSDEDIQVAKSYLDSLNPLR